MKTYRTTIWPLAIVLFIGVSLMMFGAYKPTKGIIWTLQIMSPMIILLMVSVVSSGWLTYIKINNREMELVNTKLFRKKADIKKITHISQKGTFYVFENMIRSLFVYYTNDKGKERFMQLSMGLYDEKTLQQLIKDLLEINPNIKLDKTAEKLLRTGKVRG